MSAATAIRDLNAAQAVMKKARKAIRLAADSPGSDRARQVAIKESWSALARTYRTLADLPIDLAVEDVLDRSLAVQRYATALTVRVRRLARGGSVDVDGDLDEFDGLDDE